MITRLYVNNFRCLVNFELKFDPMTLLLGPNGAGKTSVMDVIQRIRDLVSLNATIRQAFPQDTVTSWVKTRTQEFELEMQFGDGVYTYTLVVGHTDDKMKNRIERELLLYDGKKLFEFAMGEVQLYRDDFGMGPTYTFDWSMSALATIVPRSDNKKLTTFRDALQSVVLLSLDPRKMGGADRYRDCSTVQGWCELCILVQVRIDGIPGQGNGTHRAIA
jgi:energy-coupling factor transporter ATP-binding protein EcfA2